MHSTRHASPSRAASQANPTSKHRPTASLGTGRSTNRRSVPLKLETLLDLDREPTQAPAKSRRPPSVQSVLLGAELSALSRLRPGRESTATPGLSKLDEKPVSNKRLSTATLSGRRPQTTPQRGSATDIKNRLLSLGRSPPVNVGNTRSSSPSATNPLHPTTLAASAARDWTVMSRSRRAMSPQDPMRVPYEEQRAVHRPSRKSSQADQGTASSMARPASPMLSFGDKKTRRPAIPSLSIFSHHKASSLRAMTPNPFASSPPLSKEASLSAGGDTALRRYRAQRSRSSNDLATMAAPVGDVSSKPIRLKPRDNDSSVRPKRQTRKIPRGGVRNWFDGIDISSDDEDRPAIQKSTTTTGAMISRSKETRDLDSWSLESQRAEPAQVRNPQNLLQRSNSAGAARALHCGDVYDLRTKTCDDSDKIYPGQFEATSYFKTPPLNNPSKRSQSALGMRCPETSVMAKASTNRQGGRGSVASDRLSQTSGVQQRREESISPVMTSGTIPIKLGSQIVDPPANAVQLLPSYLAKLHNENAALLPTSSKPLPNPPSSGDANVIARNVPTDAAHMMAVTEEEMILLESIRHKRAAKQLNAVNDVYQQLARRRESMLAKVARRRRESELMKHAALASSDSYSPNEEQNHRAIYSLLQQEHVDTARKLEQYFAHTETAILNASAPLQTTSPHGLVLQPTVYKAAPSSKPPVTSAKPASIRQSRRVRPNPGLPLQHPGSNDFKSHNKTGRTSHVMPTNLFVEEAIPDCPGPPPSGPLPQAPASAQHLSQPLLQQPWHPSTKAETGTNRSRSASAPSQKLSISVPGAGKALSRPDLPKRAMSNPPCSVVVRSIGQQVSTAPQSTTCSSPADGDCSPVGQDAERCSRSQSVSTLQDPTIDSPNSVLNPEGIECYVLPTTSFGQGDDHRKADKCRLSVASVNSMGQEILDAWADLGGGRSLV